MRTVAFLQLVSIFFTASIWFWIISRPENYFHDQGGMAITIVYFPVTFCVWFLFAFVPLSFSFYRLNSSRRTDVPFAKDVLLANFLLVVVGVFLSIGTLFLR
tara:strand:- start:152 stop:457 length:306 start_codon:yes stop_codon:yes gene_type:complete